MTKKHFILIAAVLRRQYDAAETQAERNIITRTAANMADEFAGENARFNRGTFMLAATGSLHI